MADTRTDDDFIQFVRKNVEKGAQERSDQIVRDLTFANFEIARLKREREFATLMAKRFFWTSICFIVGEAAIGSMFIILLRKGIIG